MEQNANQENQTAKQIAALHAISSKYHKVIASDAIVQRDMEELMGFLRTSNASSGQHSEKIINHLLAEIHESVEDEQRMDEEGPTCQNVQNTCSEQDYFRFKESVLETIADTVVSDPAEILQDTELKGNIDSWLDQLTDKQREVVARRFGLRGYEMSTLEEVGREIVLTRERVRQIQVEALKRLRDILEKEGLSGANLFA